MKTLRNIFSVMLATVAVIGLFSCEEESPVYEPAQKESGSQVYFSKDVVAVSSYNIRGVKSLPIQISRADTIVDATIGIKAVCGNPAIHFPKEVKFTAGKATANYVITIDESGIEDNTPYEVSLKIGNDTTKYGPAQYDFTLASELPWIKFSKGHMIEGWWGEEEDETMYFQQISENVRYCYITNCFDTEGGAEPTNYYFYWDTNTNYLSIPMQYMGFTNSSGYKVYFSDGATFYEAYYGLDYLNSKGFADGVAFLYDHYGDPRPYYDGNGNFYLADYFYFDPAGDKRGSGYQFGGTMDCFMAETDEKGNVFVRKDFTLEVAYNGTYTDDEGTLGVLAIVTPGADVENVRVAVCVAGSEADCMNAVVEGTATFAETTGGLVKVPFGEAPVDGKYTVLAVSYGDEEAQEVATATFKYEAPRTGEETWTLVGTGDYTYTLVFTQTNEETNEEEPAVDPDLELYQCDQDKTKYKITHWCFDVDFNFTMLSTGAVYVPEQETGYTHPTYGMINIVENVDYWETLDYGTSSYDASTGTFTFCITYFVSAGNFGAANRKGGLPETFVLKADDEGSVDAPARRGQVKSATNMYLQRAPKEYKTKFYFMNSRL